MLKITPFIQKTIKPSFFDEFEDPRKDYEIDFNKLWISLDEFDKLELNFQFFSSELLIEGILFKKSSKSDWFRNRYYELYQDRLICYKDASKDRVKGIMILRGVKMEIFENFLELLNLNHSDDFESFERRMFVFSRNEKFYPIYAGTQEIYKTWLIEFKKTCILTNFNRYYTNLKIIGKGTFAKVLHSQKNIDKKDYAIKTFEKDSMLKSKTSNRSKISLLNEINIMRQLDHPNIIKMNEVYEGEFHIYIVLELLKGGELFDRIVKKGSYSEKDAAILIAKLLKALEYLHSKGVMHRDIKPENLILKDEMSFDLKLADFGLSELINKKENLFTRCGTPGYVAPEVLEDKKYDTKCDIFSAGVILYILLTGCSPFFGKNYNEILSKNRQGIANYDFKDKLKIKISQPAIDLMKWMMTIDPIQRPTATEALCHFWIIDHWLGIEKDSKLLPLMIDEKEKDEFNLSFVQRNMQNFQKGYKIDTSVAKKDFGLVVNSPLINGQTLGISTDSPLLNTPNLKHKKRGSTYSNECLSKFGFYKPSLKSDKSDGEENYDSINANSFAISPGNKPRFPDISDSEERKSSDEINENLNNFKSEESSNNDSPTKIIKLNISHFKKKIENNNPIVKIEEIKMDEEINNQIQKKEEIKIDEEKKEENNE